MNGWARHITFPKNGRYGKKLAHENKSTVTSLLPLFEKYDG